MAKLNLFLDTNIIIDLLADRKPFSNAAYEIFNISNLKKWNLYTSSNSILTSYYILEKYSSSKDSKRALETILKRVQVQDISKSELLNALKSKIEDFEDASQNECANKVGKIHFIITRDKKGFKHSKFEVLSSDELVVLKTNAR